MYDPRPQDPPDYYDPKPDKNSDAYAERVLDQREAADWYDEQYPTNTMDHGGTYRWSDELQRVVIVRK